VAGTAKRLARFIGSVLPKEFLFENVGADLDKVNQIIEAIQEALAAREEQKIVEAPQLKMLPHAH